MPVRLLAVDVDGTLLTSDKRLPDAHRDALREAAARGCTVVLASGRMVSSILHAAQGLGLDGPIISHNGARVVGPASEGRPLHWQRPLAARHADAILDYHAQHRIQLNYYLDDALYTKDDPGMRPWMELYARRTGSEATYVENLDRFRGREPTKLILILDQEGRDRLHDEFARRYPADQVRLMKTDPEYLEFLDPGVNKGVALASLCAKMGIPIEETMAVGDGDNDADMIAAAGVGVAMANGSPAAKAAADHITARTNDEDGLAEAIEQFILR